MSSRDLSDAVYAREALTADDLASYLGIVKTAKQPSSDRGFDTVLVGCREPRGPLRQISSEKFQALRRTDRAIVRVIHKLRKHREDRLRRRSRISRGRDVRRIIRISKPWGK